MTTDQMIKHIEDDLVCANNCPQHGQAKYDIDHCFCYKREIISELKCIRQMAVRHAKELLAL